MLFLNAITEWAIVMLSCWVGYQSAVSMNTNSQFLEYFVMLVVGVSVCVVFNVLVFLILDKLTD